MTSQLALAAAALIGLTLFVYLMITVLGVMANARGQLSAEYSKNKTGAPPPDWLANWGRNLVNLCELPMLFYALVAMHLALTGTADGLQVHLAWAFVASRYIHTLVHVTVNNVGLRFLAHRVGFVILAVMWVKFVLAVM